MSIDSWKWLLCAKQNRWGPQCENYGLWCGGVGSGLVRGLGVKHSDYCGKVVPGSAGIILLANSRWEESKQSMVGVWGSPMMQQAHLRHRICWRSAMARSRTPMTRWPIFRPVFTLCRRAFLSPMKQLPIHPKIQLVRMLSIVFLYKFPRIWGCRRASYSLIRK